MEWDKDSKIDDLREDMTSAEAAEVFGTDYDEPIQQLLHALHHLGYTDEEFEALLDRMKMLMEATVPIPAGLTVETSMPYVWVSDLLTLGSLSYELFQRRDQIEKEHGH